MRKRGIFGKLFRLALLAPIMCMAMFLIASLVALLIATVILLK